MTLLTIKQANNGFIVSTSDFEHLSNFEYVFTDAKTCTDFVSEHLAKTPKRVSKETPLRLASAKMGMKRSDY